MTYIVNPAWFYWMSVAQQVKTFGLVVGGLAIFGTVISTFIGFAEGHDTEEADEWWKKNGIKLLCAEALFVLALLFIPTQETLEKMLIAKSITVETVNAGVDVVKSTVDYIFQKITELK